MSVRVLLAGGGSAGHVSPLLAVADCLLRRDSTMKVDVLGTTQGLEARVVPDRGYQLHTLPRVPLPRRVNADLLRLGPRLVGAVRRAGRVIDLVKADVVVGFGGYVCPPVYLAARRRGVPIVVHEANPIPGVANRMGARLTPWVAITYSETNLPRAIHTGLPLSRAITELAFLDSETRSVRQRDARISCGLQPDIPTLLVTGGSLGAQRLNETFAAASVRVRAAGIQILHITGVGKPVEVPAPERDSDPRHVTIPYVDDMAAAYLAADFVVCRAGANTVQELAAVGLPAAYVPLPVGNGEQRLNAEPLAKAGGGVLVADTDCSPTWVTGTLLPLLRNPTLMGTMATAARRFAAPDADERVADLILRAASRPPSPSKISSAA
ncbi:MAG: UDP-N-acetylglucosamine--N-acetylmuramyl-(pentapeptide) pyrophosphoryl-undecaprenol N-acetylglucosamine transferase [Actinomycetota bacterium]